jgi:hypothetical protein
VTFPVESKLSRLEQDAFSFSGLKSIAIPALLEIICENCFQVCASLESMRFPPESQSSQLEQEAFLGSGLKSIAIPASVKMIGQWCCNGNEVKTPKRICPGRRATSPQP